ncbi:hypothetical protein CC86DRAFT_412591 [Ophiobolus disseminans]|uniref:Uncharacterized protein n=1 Tax=Ophiobolus disseminans TaxID=1469910 RepID=A0A6A6ZGY1_9PLEO|nr:hypothetical protein CC86DRAFT_412591 [Ophiobolus disseminans]
MATAGQLPCGYIKIEDTPSPEPFLEVVAVAPAPVNIGAPAGADPPVLLDPRDPESYLKRCSGLNKKTKVRCNSTIGKKSEQSCHPTYLPTCRAHRDQQSYAGWCQFQYRNGERCSRLFKWTPPHFELCAEHEGHPDTPCYFFRLPLELRHEVYRYLLPSRPIGSSTAVLHDGQQDAFGASFITYPPAPLPPGASFPPPPGQPSLHGPPIGNRTNVLRHHMNHGGTPAQCGVPDNLFPMPALDLFLVNHQFYLETKDLLFSTVPFTIDVRKDGTFMCGRRLLEPRRADGSSHYLIDEADEAKQRFLKYFDFSAVKHYAVDILVENWATGMVYPHNSTWDEEVELYDIRDYISVVVSGVLAKSRNLCKLQVHLCLADFDWSHEQTLANTKLIVGPFESLRNVRQPQILGVSMGKPNHNAMLTIQRPVHSSGSRAPICSVPPLPRHTLCLMPGMPDFDAYASDWARWMSASSSSTITKKPPIRSMFTAFKDFYSELSSVVHAVTYVSGRQGFLHRARVAREQEDVESFRHLRNELIQYWYAYLEQEERKKNDLNKRMSRMLDSDIYPSHEWDQSPNPSRRSSSTTQASSSKSPVFLDPASMAKEGIPMAANPHKHHFQPMGCNMGVLAGPLHNPARQMHMQQIASAILPIGQTQQQMQTQLQRQMAQNQARCQAMRQAALAQSQTHAYLHVQNTTTKRALQATCAPESHQTSALPYPSQPWDQTQFQNSNHAPHHPTHPPNNEDLYAGPNDAVDEWWAQPGPSQERKKRRVDSGFSEMSGVEQEEQRGEVGYVGKGKGRMVAGAGVEVICLE